MRRMVLRCRQMGLGMRRRGRISTFLQAAFAFTVAVGFGLSILPVAAVSWPWHRDHVVVDEFIESFQHMFDQGEPPGSAGLVVGAAAKDGDPPPGRYDPKARVFIDPSMRRKYGQEAEKGRHKRKLFLEVHEMTKEKGRPHPTLSQLMGMPSSFDPSEGVSDTTIILNQWTRTTLEEQLDAILRQTVRPAGGVWVCAFNSPRESEYRAVVDKYRARFAEAGGGAGGGLFFVASSFNFKYYGRFQMALQARTKYVWVVDDDVMPGSRFLQQLSHIAGIYEAEGADGSIAPMALGSVGWIMPGVKATEKFYSYRYHTDKGGLYLPDKRYGIPVPNLQEVDLLCSHWFVETDWVRLLFREKWETAETGEDYMLAYSLRKHAGVRSYVVPMDLRDSETWGNVDVEWNMQNQGGGATTLRSTVPMRDRIWHRLLKRGGEYFMSTRYAPHPRPVLLVIDGAYDASALSALFLELQASYPPTTGGEAVRSSALAATGGDGGYSSPPSSSTDQRPPRVLLTGRGSGAASCSLVARSLGNVGKKSDGRGATLCNPDTFASAWNLIAGRHFPRQGTGRAGGSGGRDHVLMADLAVGLAGAVETLKPLAIVSVAGTGVAAGLHGGVGGGGAAIDEALAVVAGQTGVPSIRLARKTNASAAALWLSRLTPMAFRAWNKPQIDIVVVYEPSGGGHTEAQLKALLDSLGSAHYLGDTVGLTVAVGSGTVPSIVHDGAFPWPRGRKVVRGGSLRPSPPAGHGGDSGGGGGGRIDSEGVGFSSSLAALALRSWVPRDDDNLVVVLEADRVVSPLFYSWLKVALLETNFGGAAPKPSASGSAAGTAGGICLPSADANGGGDSGTWLLPAEHWRVAQARCLNPNSVGAPEMACGRKGYPELPERSLCPALEHPAEALVGRTGADGVLLDKTGPGLLEDGGALSSFVGRVLFS